MFEVKEHDLWGRIGEIQTPSGKIETPALFPVVGSSNNIVSPRDLSEIFKFDSVITSAYLLSKRHEDPSSIDIHKRLDFDGTVMMDSGAYQILMYGDIELSLEESLALQQKVNADIGVILDIPTSMTDSFESAKKKVDETLLRAEQALEFLDKDRIWTLPIQGGKRIELIRYFTEKAIASDFLPSYQMFAIGSIAPIMSSYAYTTVGKMILTSRQNLPLDRPLHLFGGGHPMIFAFSVALGCDTFDSAAYVLMAKDGRYMTRFGTKRIENLDYFPCDCPECSKTTPETIRELNKMDQMAFLARHNLWVSQGEIRTIKQAIKEGTLSELLEARISSHPALFKAYHNLITNKWMDSAPVSTIGSKPHIITKISTNQPNFHNFSKKLSRVNRLLNAQAKNILLVAIDFDSNIYQKMKDMIEGLTHYDKEIWDKLQVRLLHPIWGLIPIELLEVHPFVQLEFSSPSIFRDKFEESVLNHISTLNNKIPIWLCWDQMSWNSSSINALVSLLQKNTNLVGITNNIPSHSNRNFKDTLNKMFP